MVDSLGHKTLIARHRHQSCSSILQHLDASCWHPFRLYSKGNCERGRYPRRCGVCQSNTRQSVTNCRFMVDSSSYRRVFSCRSLRTWQLPGSVFQVFMHEIRVMQLDLLFDMLMDGCIIGGGIGHRIRRLSPIHITDLPVNHAYL